MYEMVKYNLPWRFDVVVSVTAFGTEDLGFEFPPGSKEFII
jgi:hypothetical protein